MTAMPFEPSQYFAELGFELVRDFARSRQTNHPGVKGSIKESRSRSRLADLLPGMVSVGQGFVIDSYGLTSRQADLVLFERDLCSQFDLGSEEAAHFPLKG
jgi:hypothetical protein